MPRPVRVTLDPIHFPYMDYFEWLVFGLQLLHDAGEIEFKLQTTATTPPFRLHAKAAPAMRRVLPGLMDALSRGSGAILTGSLETGGEKRRFLVDLADSPYMFQVDALLETDVYFKVQCPATLDPRGFPIARDAFVPYHPDVLTYQNRIHPAMLGRPLSRTLNQRQNARILERWQAAGHGVKDVALFAYFGTDKGLTHGPEGVVMQRFGDRVSHPNLKRGRLVEELRRRYPTQCDARVLTTEHASRRGPQISDARYPETVGRAWHNINISGFRRSLPFRFVDSFLTGAAVPADELALRWYEPFEMGTEVIDLGPMGYEREDAVDWDHVWRVLDALYDEPLAVRKERQAHIAARFERYWHPRAFARYVVQTCMPD